jgi:hypothetical protein
MPFTMVLECSYISSYTPNLLIAVLGIEGRV